MSNPFRPVAPASNSFLPEDYIARKAETRTNLLILSLFAVVMAAVIGAFFVTNKRWTQLRERQAAVNAQYVEQGKKIEQLKNLEGQRAQMMEKAEITATLVERVPRWAVLGEVTLRMPKGMWLESFNMKSTRTDPPPPAPKGPVPSIKTLTGKIAGTPPKEEKPPLQAPRFSYAVTIVGGAADNSAIADFLTGLKASPALDKVELGSIKEAKLKDKVIRKFELTATLRTDVDPTTLAESLRRLVADRTATLEGKDPNSPDGAPRTADGTPKQEDGQ